VHVPQRAPAIDGDSTCIAQAYPKLATIADHQRRWRCVPFACPFRPVNPFEGRAVEAVQCVAGEPEIAVGRLDYAQQPVGCAIVSRGADMLERREAWRRHLCQAVSAGEQRDRKKKRETASQDQKGSDHSTSLHRITGGDRRPFVRRLSAKPVVPTIVITERMTPLK
jgi:hypothetical protein